MVRWKIYSGHEDEVASFYTDVCSAAKHTEYSDMRKVKDLRESKEIDLEIHIPN